MRVIGRILWAGLAPVALAIWDDRVAKAAALTTPKVRPPPPEVITPPAGWRYAKQKEITPEMSAFAIQTLNQKLLPGNTQKATTSSGQQYGAMTDWHYDNHVSVEEKWHIGVSIVVPAAFTMSGFYRQAA